MCVSLSLSKSFRFSERQHKGNIWERVTSWPKNKKVSSWEAQIAVRAGMSRNSSSQTATCVCPSLCHLLIASHIGLPFHIGKSLWKSSEMATSSLNVSPALGLWAGTSYTQNCPSPGFSLVVATFSQLQSPSKQLPSNIPNFRQSSIYK